MLSDATVQPMLPVKNLEAARKFYEGPLGLKKVGEEPNAAVTYKSGGSTVVVYKSEFAGTNKGTAALWEVKGRPVPVAEQDGDGDEGRREAGEEVGDAMQVVARHRIAEPRDEQQRCEALHRQDAGGDHHPARDAQEKLPGARVQRQPLPPGEKGDRRGDGEDRQPDGQPRAVAPHRLRARRRLRLLFPGLLERELDRLPLLQPLRRLALRCGRHAFQSSNFSASSSARRRRIPIRGRPAASRTKPLHQPAVVHSSGQNSVKRGRNPVNPGQTQCIWQRMQ
jgi:catechol 2,3-dioxygenase-like lactoylglutathione lyase family enzyme